MIFLKRKYLEKLFIQIIDKCRMIKIKIFIYQSKLHSTIFSNQDFKYISDENFKIEKNLIPYKL